MINDRRTPAKKKRARLSVLRHDSAAIYYYSFVGFRYASRLKINARRERVNMETMDRAGGRGRRNKHFFFRTANIMNCSRPKCAGQKQGTKRGAAMDRRSVGSDDAGQRAVRKSIEGRRRTVPTDQQDLSRLGEEDTDQRHELSADGKHSKVRART